MQVTEVANDGLKRAYTVVVPAGDIEAERSRRLGELGRELRLPGFRPGKIPASVVKQRYGQAVMSEVLEQSVNKATQQIVTDRGLRPALQPKIELVNFADAADLEFKLELELMPDIPMPDFAGIAVERLKAEPGEAAVARALESIGARNRSLEDINEERPGETGEVAVCDFVGHLKAAGPELLAEPALDPAANALPKSWRLRGEKEGLATLLGTGEEDGLGYADIRFAGVMKATRLDVSPAVVPAQVGDTFFFAAHVRMVGGSVPPTARLQLTLAGRDAEGKAVRNSVAALPAPDAAALAGQRHTGMVTVVGDDAGTAVVGVLAMIQMVRLGEEPLDFTLRVAAPSLTSGAGGVEAEPFPGGSATDMPIEIGGGGFIPGFTEQLAGIRAGETRMIDVAFPADYGSKDLAGKAAVFTVTCKGLKKSLVPAADDALAQTLGFEDLGKLQEAIRGSLQQEYDSLARLKVKRALLDGLAERASFAVPDGLVEAEFKQIWERIEQDLKAGRLDEDDKGKDEATLRADYRGIAERRIRLGLLLSEIGRTNNITVTAEELTRAMRQEASRYPGQEKQVMEFFQKNPQAADNLRSPIFEDKVVDFMLELAQVTDRVVAPEELSATTA